MAENLNYQTSDSWCYDGDPSNCDIYGRLYTWDAALDACPVGWSLPTRDDWGALAIVAGGTGTYGNIGSAGTALKSQSGWSDGGNGTDAFGFSALPGGFRWYDGGFGGIGFYGYWWAATEYGSDGAYDRNMNSGYAGVWEDWDIKSNWFSVRCLRD